MSLYEKINFKDLSDSRGGLVAIEGLKNIPFELKRIYYLFGTKDQVERGFHAHKVLKQVAICVSGSCDITFDNGKFKEIITLDSPLIGVTIDPLIWHEMKNFSKNCVFLVLASDYYDENDYIRTYEEFKNTTQNTED